MPSVGVVGPGRWLRLASPVRLELVPASDPRRKRCGRRCPERAREAVLVVLVRLIGSGAVEEKGA